MLAKVRNRRGLITSVTPFDGGIEGRVHLVTIEYLDPDGAPEYGEGPHLAVRSRSQADIDDMPRFVTSLFQPAGQRGGQLGVDEEAHRSGAAQDRVIGLPGSELERSHDVSRLEVGLAVCVKMGRRQA